MGKDNEAAPNEAGAAGATKDQRLAMAASAFLTRSAPIVFAHFW